MFFHLEKHVGPPADFLAEASLKWQTMVLDDLRESRRLLVQIATGMQTKYTLGILMAYLDVARWSVQGSMQQSLSMQQTWD